MAKFEYNILNRDLILGYSFQDASTLTTIAYRRLAPLFREKWSVNGFPIMGIRKSYEDLRWLEVGLTSYVDVPNEPHRVRYSKTRMASRWTLQLCYRKAETDQYDIEHEFKLHDRHDKFVGKETCKLSKHSLVLETHRDGLIESLPDELVEQEIRAVFAYIAALESEPNAIKSPSGDVQISVE